MVTVVIGLTILYIPETIVVMMDVIYVWPTTVYVSLAFFGTLAIPIMTLAMD